MTQYAIKVPLPEDDWLYVTKNGPTGIEVLKYDDREQAERHAKIWNGKGVVVEYQNDESQSDD